MRKEQDGIFVLYFSLTRFYVLSQAKKYYTKIIFGFNANEFCMPSDEKSTPTIPSSDPVDT